MLSITRRGILVPLLNFPMNTPAPSDKFVTTADLPMIVEGKPRLIAERAAEILVEGEKNGTRYDAYGLLLKASQDFNAQQLRGAAPQPPTAAQVLAIIERDCTPDVAKQARAIWESLGKPAYCDPFFLETQAKADVQEESRMLAGDVDAQPLAS